MSAAADLTEFCNMYFMHLFMKLACILHSITKLVNGSIGGKLKSLEHHCKLDTKRTNIFSEPRLYQSGFAHAALILKENELQITGESIAVESSRQYRDLPGISTKCPTILPNNLSSDIKDRSLCPWYTVVNKNPRRVPMKIFEAKCKCQKCVVPKRDSMYFQTACEPVYHNVPVLKYIGKCANGKKVYRRTTERVPMACVCGRRREAGS